VNMDEIIRLQHGNAQSAFARQQQGVPPMQAPPGQANQTWLLHGPGQPAPREHFNFEPTGSGAWRIYPPGRAAPGHRPQGSLPVMPPFDHLKSLSDDLDKNFGKGAPPPVLGPFPTVPPPSQSPRQGPKPSGGTPGLV
jgi:hypothetical protein